MQRMNENRSLENKPLGDLFSDLASEMSNLVRQEVALAKWRLAQKAKYVGKNVGYLVVGGASRSMPRCWQSSLQSSCCWLE